MGWERRKRGLYYYKKVRRGRRVASVYVSQRIAPVVAQLAAERRAQRELQQHARQCEREVIRVIDAEVDHVVHLTLALTQAALMDAGYHLHRGEWRRRKHARKSHHDRR